MNQFKFFGLLFFLVLFLSKGLIGQNKVSYYYITDKGIYLEMNKVNYKLKVPFKENNSFNFKIINDTTAIIENIIKNKIVNSKIYNISTKCEVVYIKSYSILKGKKKLHIEKRIYRKVSPPL